jgi:hypothetical protein
MAGGKEGNMSRDVIVSWRTKLQRYLIDKVWKVPIGQKLPLLLLIINCLLFPLRALYFYNSDLKYDTNSDTYTIRKLQISGVLFDAWNRDGFPEGTVFRLEKRGKNGIITIKRYNNLMEILKDFGAIDITKGEKNELN